ncbi:MULTISPECIES: FAD-dependent oxidoreductase [unclassified Microbacterium]|uniref:FAD-dependent oxidoreductase n=1 Tax=unclassified Microbacterium TaxID=2609290 RepID=UPI003015FC0F
MTTEKTQSTDAAVAEVDVLVVGSGSGGMTAAVTAAAAGCSVLVVEKADRFGGSSALSGGGLWVPGAPAQRRGGYAPDPEETVAYLTHLTHGDVTDERIRAYVDAAPRMLEFLERLGPHMQFVWKPGYPDYFPEAPGGSARGSVINIPPIDRRELGADESKLLSPHGIVPNGMWIAPNELRDFYQLRQTWRAKRLFVRLVWRMVRARLTGERVVTIGQALMTRLFLTARDLGVDLWLDAPMTDLLTDGGAVVGATVDRGGRTVRVLARGGVIIASGGFEHDRALRAEHQPSAHPEYSLGAETNTGDGIRAAASAGAALERMDSAWWYPCISWGPGRVQFSLNERMMPAQLIVDSTGARYINEATPYSEFGLAMIEAEGTDAPRIPSWLITDDRSWRKYIIFGHLPLPKIPFAPAPTGHALPASWRESGSVVTADSIADLARGIGVAPERLDATVARYNSMASTGEDTDFGRGRSEYDRYYSDTTLATPNLLPLGNGPYYAFKLILADLGTNGGVVTDGRARALRPDGMPIPGLYATGNASSSVMGYSYAGAGATIGPAMAFGHLAAQDAVARVAAGRAEPGVA